MSVLYQRSVEIILNNQTPSGAYLACPNFPTYHYSWFRDGSFIAYAMNLAGHHESAMRFHAWASASINAREELVARAVAAARAGQPLQGEDLLHTRYTADGAESADGTWPNFQLDGFGTWLWSMGEHARLCGTPLADEWRRAADSIAAYLSALWALPCYDCWEEFPDKVHPHTLAAIYGGLWAHAEWTGADHTTVLSGIRAYLLERAVSEGRFVKYIGSYSVDASLLGLAVPYRVVPPDDETMRATVAAIERDLRAAGGVHRYLEDSYYGGGEWTLLACWLGWYYSRVGQMNRARELLNWVEGQADQAGEFPEQVPTHLLSPQRRQEWVERWGPVAKPLLWSHAKYIILRKELGA